MKKILEVIECGDHDIRFKTDFDPANEQGISELIGKLAFTMITRLRGQEEVAVIAMIRALALADFSVCTDREAMIRAFDEHSAHYARIINKTLEFMKKRGCFVEYPVAFGPSKSVS